MDLKGYSHVYECYPPLWFNTNNEVCVKLKCVPKLDYDAHVDMITTFGSDKSREEGHKFIAKHVLGIEGLTVEGEEITTFDQLLTDGPSDMYSWIYMAVLYQEKLTKAEVKN